MGTRENTSSNVPRLRLVFVSERTNKRHHHQRSEIPPLAAPTYFNRSFGLEPRDVEFRTSQLVRVISFTNVL
jgi:hypothetical protein